MQHVNGIRPNYGYNDDGGFLLSFILFATSKNTEYPVIG